MGSACSTKKQKKHLSDSDEERIKHAYQLLYSRVPDAQELELGLLFLSTEKHKEDKLSRWEQYAQALLGANEFMYLD